MDANARIVPEKELYAPSVADEPTTQYTADAAAPSVSTTALDVAVVSADPARKTYVPAPRSVRLPVRPIAVGDAYAPGASVSDPMSSPAPSATAEGPSAVSSVIIAVTAACAAIAAGVFTSSAPV